ncbi:MAG: hypothetical protein ACYC6Y_30855, partial [Thermoguttaceae bacterium]
LEFRGESVLIVRQTLPVQTEVGKLLEDLGKGAAQHGNDVLPTREPKKPEASAPVMEGYLGGGSPGAEQTGEMKGFF